ncbi:hypothetical protein ACEQPO_23320 [Bacillus sp. SL00103]
MIKELKKAAYMPSSLEETVEGIQPEQEMSTEEYSFQFSWDRHATFKCPIPCDGRAQASH